MCACIQNGILRNGQQSQSVVNGFIDQSEFPWEILPVLNIWQLHALLPLSNKNDAIMHFRFNAKCKFTICLFAKQSVQ